MKTMFVSQENNGNKNKFQKPNILRRKSKGPIVKPNITENYESLGGKSLVNEFNPKIDLSLEKIPKVKCSKPFSKKPVQRVILDNFIRNEDVASSHSRETNIHIKSDIPSSGDQLLSSSMYMFISYLQQHDTFQYQIGFLDLNLIFFLGNEENVMQMVNIDSFLNDGGSTEV